MEQAILAAGCFWAVQDYFDQVPGVVNTTAGYSGGSIENPTYEDVCSGKTGHAEAVLVEFDVHRLTYPQLLRHFFRMHDPTQLNRQGADVGDNYRSAIFYTTDAQREDAERALAEAQKDHQAAIMTKIEPAGPFYQAEDYHQHYAARTGRGTCHIPYKTLK